MKQTLDASKSRGAESNLVGGTVDAEMVKRLQAHQAKQPTNAPDKRLHTVCAQAATILLERLAQAENQVVRDPHILSGTPVFKGTRVPIDTVLGMSEAGETEAEIRKHYPAVTQAMIADASIYRVFHPKEAVVASALFAGRTIISTKTIPRKR